MLIFLSNPSLAGWENSNPLPTHQNLNPVDWLQILAVLLGGLGGFALTMLKIKKKKLSQTTICYWIISKYNYCTQKLNVDFIE